MHALSVSDLIRRLSECPPEARVRLVLGDVELPAGETELVQGGWDPPVVRIVVPHTGSDTATRLQVQFGSYLPLLVAAALAFLIGYLVGHG